MNRFVLSLLMLGLSLSPVLCWAVETQPKAGGDTAAQLKTAQEERVKVLTDLVKMETELQKTGTVDLVDQLFSAESELCNAQLDSTDEPEKRIALLTKQLDKANDVVRILQARYESGTVFPQDVLRAKSQYLAVKIKLLRERSRMKPPTPTAQAADNAPTKLESAKKPTLHFESISKDYEGSTFGQRSRAGGGKGVGNEHGQTKPYCFDHVLPRHET